ncbi:hypothetical protein [Streptomyces sp. NPDC015125]|uniref:hypothetical protein n=1 Tax=Streptomyces sp. NPDC015125 TaxID=3364938 RepID=UPI0036F7212B
MTSMPTSPSLRRAFESSRERLHESWPADAVRSLWHAAPGAGGFAIKAMGAVAPFVFLYTCLTLTVGCVKAATGSTHTGLLATVTTPVGHYLLDHTGAAGLPLTAGAAYALWQILGMASFPLAVYRSNAARVVWLLWGALTVAMVWAGAPAAGRTVAAGVTLLGFAVCSAAALRGLRIRRPVAPIGDSVRSEGNRTELHLHYAHSTLGPYRVSRDGIHLN